LGFTPIFCDINIRDYSFDVEHMKQIKKVHPDIKMIFVTHLLGFAAKNHVYKSVFPDAIILDDVCESHGCRDVHGEKVGKNSLGATFSFYFGHHMTTIEGGMVNTNNTDLYDLMRMKRSHGLAREASDPKKYQKMWPKIHPQFLFMTDGYNFRSSDLNAVLGMSQLPRLDSAIEQRRENFSRFVQIIESHQGKFHKVYWQEGNSNFALPFICRNPELTKKMKVTFEENGIEHRPIVGGNLLKQPFLKNYEIAVPRGWKNKLTVDLINDNGVYIGNSHFVTKKDMDWLESILEKIHE
jgi:CDP-6-deoxy-D-xylo-4-hexulose-3-dehydrase